MLQFYLTLVDGAEEKSKFEQIYIQYRGLMLSRAYEILRDTGLAEDAVHNAFIRILQNIAKLDDVESPRTKSFVVIVAENVAKTMYAKNMRQNVVPLDETYQSPVSIAEAAESRISAEYVAQKIAELPEQYSRVMMLKYLNQLTNREIASALKISEAAVRKRLERARRELSRLLEEE
ncbi:MAG: sigma-70 family RNA polymerase sigma factor [Ruminococcus sp.]|nr:sigma-70 family RNA polymerase sigma factor [Ruminococcus sp.]